MKKILFLISTVGFLFSVDYESEIQPIWDAHCGGCHLGNGSSGGLNLNSYDNLMSSGSVVPGSALQSELYDRIVRPESQPGDMPPAGSLSAAQIDLIAQWINEGALPEESIIVSGCTDPNAITCEDEIDTLYFPECDTCSDDDPCENYYNPNAVEDNGLCMYDDIPSYDEFTIEYYDVGIDGTSGFLLDWSAFTPPVDITQYALQRCVDFDGDSDGDGELEYDVCNMIIPPNSFYLDTNYSDSYTLDDGAFLKYTLYVHYPNNNYWGSAQGYYYYESDSCDLSSGDVNEDGILNVIDIVNLVNYILGSGSLTDCQLEAADMNSDSIVNVIDIVNLVNIILN